MTEARKINRNHDQKIKPKATRDFHAEVFPEIIPLEVDE